jgi:hypothetical protein
LVATAFLNLKPKIISEFALGDELTAKTNTSSIDDPRGIYGSTADVSFGICACINYLTAIFKYFFIRIEK